MLVTVSMKVVTTYSTSFTISCIGWGGGSGILERRGVGASQLSFIEIT
jgi:hypothetical protein